MEPAAEPHQEATTALPASSSTSSPKTSGTRATTGGYVEAHDALANAITDRIFEPLDRAPAADRAAVPPPASERTS